jgi:hypothetical protein
MYFLPMHAISKIHPFLISRFFTYWDPDDLEDFSLSISENESLQITGTIKL